MSFTYPHKHIFHPSNSQTSKRVFILFHGTGGNEHDLVPVARRMDPDASILGIRGNVSENGMPRFFTRHQEGIFDENDIRRRAEELASFINEAADIYDFDLEDVVSLGYSNGANIITAINFLHPGLFRKSVLWRPMTPLVPAESPTLNDLEVLLTFGSMDPLMPPGEMEKLTGLYRSYGANVTVTNEPTGHQLVPQDLESTTEWLKI